MRRILLVLTGTIVLPLLALSPASARPFYQSDLICLPEFADYGFAVILHPSGDLHVTLQTAGPPLANEPVQCQITCNNDLTQNPPGTVVLGPVPCGVTKSAGKVVFRAKGTSGYPTPQ